MISSLGASDYDLPYGSELIVGEVNDPRNRQVDRVTAERWVAHGLLEIVDEPIFIAPVQTMEITAGEAVIPRVRRGRSRP
jgi:hypothetical protein